MPRLKAGSRLRSAVCDTEVMVIQAPGDADVDLRCGGSPMLDHAAERPGGTEVAEGASGGTALGKRYVDQAGDLEILCTRPGQGSLALGDAPLSVKGAKPLPSSD